MRPYYSGGVLNTLASALEIPTLSTHRLRRGLLGYLILFAPHAFVLQCQNPDQTAAFATGVLPYIYAFYRYTWSSAVLFCSLADQFPEPVRVEPIPFTPDLICHLRTLYAQSFRITLATYVLPRLLARS